MQFQLAERCKHAEFQRRASGTATTLIALGHWAGLFCVAGGCAVIAAYTFGVEEILRPIAGGPATHPLTALLFIASGLAVFGVRAFRIPPSSVGILLAVGLLGVLGIVQAVSGTTFLNDMPIFSGTLERAASAGAPISIGWNTSAMFALVAAALLVRHLKHPRASQITAAIATAPSLVAMTGYIYGVAHFYGEMSLTTALLGVPLSVSPLILSARTGIVRAIISPWDGGRFGRWEIAVIAVVIFATGIVIQAQMADDHRSFIPLIVVVAILTASVTIAYGSIVIERNDQRRRRAERTVAHLVLRDALTGLYNRRFLKEQENALIGFAQRQGYQLSILMIDIDRFKTVNDQFGHPIGDKIIRMVAQTVKESLRGEDIAIRYGGEELMVVLLNADVEIAGHVGEDLRQTIADIDCGAFGFQTVTVSIGGAEVLTTIPEAVGRADAALYAAKASGRNCVIVNETHKGPVLIEGDGQAHLRRVSTAREHKATRAG